MSGGIYSELDLDCTTLTTTTGSGAFQKKKSRVSFSPVVEIKFHTMILGDHPCCRNLPISLGEHSGTEILDFEAYEDCKEPSRKCEELRMNYWERLSLLEDSTGLCEQELLSQELHNMFQMSTMMVPAKSSGEEREPSLLRRSCQSATSLSDLV